MRAFSLEPVILYINIVLGVITLVDIPVDRLHDTNLW